MGKDAESFDEIELLHSALKRSGFDVDGPLWDVARLLGRNRVLLRQVYGAVLRKEPVCEYKPRIGAALTVGFDWQGESVWCERLKDRFELPLGRFLLFLGRVDSCCVPVLPVGSVVELDIGLIPESLRQVFGDGKQPLLVMLTGRKLPLMEGFDEYVVDYFGRFWPFGEMPGQDPVAVSNMMIGKVVFEGYSTDEEDRFACQVLKLNQVIAGQVSTAFMPLHRLDGYLAAVKALAGVGDGGVPAGQGGA